MPTKKVKTKFYNFSQNNSGGGFTHKEKDGVGYNVIIEATNANKANTRAEVIGLYFDGCDTGDDCSCCGDRWYRASGEGTDKPMIYNEDVSSGKTKDTMWGINSYIHYLDGKIKKVVGPKRK